MSRADNVLQWFRLLNGNTSNTSDIFFACVGAITASTFLALHLNVPVSRDGGKSRGIYLLGRSALWGLMVVVAPELLLSLAFGDWRAAHIGREVLHKFGTGSVTDWKNKHARFANMGGFVFQMQKGEKEIPDSAPYNETMGTVRLKQALDEMNKPTLKQAEDISKRLMLKLKIWNMIYWLRIPVLLTIEFTRAATRVIHKHCWPRMTSRAIDASNHETMELEEFQNQSPRYAANIDLARPNFGVQGGEETVSSRETSEERFHSRPLSLDIGHFGSTLSVYSGDLPEPTMTSAVLVSDDIRISNGSDMEVSEDVSTEECIVDITSMRGDEQDVSNPDDTVQLLSDGSIDLYLNSMQIAAAQILGILGDLPEITLEDIKARSNTNSPAKLLAILQLLWFGLKIIIQVCRGYTISQLELASVTYVLCALLSYMLFWSKPQGVASPTKHIVHITNTVRSVTDQDIGYLQSFGGSPFLIRNFVPPFGMGYRGHEPTMPIPTDISLTTFSLFGPAGKEVFFGDSDFLGMVVGMIFGGLYCLGWNDPFPSVWEKWAWRICALVITASLIPYSIANEVCTVRFHPVVDKDGMGRTHIIHVMVLYCLLGIYICCRCFMLIEMIRSLFK